MEPIWREVFGLMWEAYLAGTIPVGALLADEQGHVVARGRNRIFDERRDAVLGRSRLAHAEMNALAELSSAADYPGLTLHTSLEPCHLCLAATTSVRVGTLRYAAVDPYAGAVGKLLPSEDMRRHSIRVEGPLAGRAGQLPELLHVRHFLWRVPEGNVITFYRKVHPDVIVAAAELPSPPDAASVSLDSLL